MPIQSNVIQPVTIATEPLATTPDTFARHRGQAFQPLAHEHQACLVFAERLATIAAQGDEIQLEAGIALLQDYNQHELERHLKHEEQTIFMPLIQEHAQYRQLCIQLGKEHGLLRTIVDTITLETARHDLAQFANVLKSHTLLEEEQLFPFIEPLLSAEQLQAVAEFVPPPPRPIISIPQTPFKTRVLSEPQDWLDSLNAFMRQPKPNKGCLVLFPRYQPEVAKLMAEALGFSFVDYQQVFMLPLGAQAEFISDLQLENDMRTYTAQGGVVWHNVEALLCVRSEAQRQAWFERFLTLSWANPILIPLTVFQAEVPHQHPQVCDLELVKMPRYLAPATHQLPVKLKYDV